MTESIARHTLSALLQRGNDPWALEDLSPALGHCCLLLDASAGAAADDEAVASLAARLARLPCPVIGLTGGSPAAGVIAAAVDVLLDHERDASALLRNIERHPFAAATLVQVLRHNEQASVLAGLAMESLAFSTLQASADFKAWLASRPVPAAPLPEHEPVTLQREDALLTITWNRPHARNAYSAAARDAMYEALQLVAADPSIRTAVVRGAGECFSTGGDLAEFGLADDPARAHLIRMSRSVAMLLAQLRERVEFHVHRACIGSGIELPAFAGRVVATADTFFQLPEITMGLIPGAGGTVSIPRRIGRHRASYLALSAKRINASTALDWGLIDAIE